MDENKHGYKTKTIQQLFGISGETVRVWAEEFGKYLSPGASPGSGKHRLFTFDDLQVLALVAETKKAGKTFDDAHMSLANGQRGEVPELPEDVTAIVQAVQLDATQRQLATLQEQNTTLQEEVIRLRAILSEREIDRRKMDEMQSEITKLNREIGRLEGQLETWKAQQKRADE